MKTAEEVAKGLAYDIALAWCKEQHQQCEKAEEIIPLIAQALAAFAEEGVKEERERFDKECPDKDHVHFKCHVIEKSNNKIRAEALEEAVSRIGLQTVEKWAFTEMNEDLKAIHWVYDYIDFQFTDWDNYKRMVEQAEAKLRGWA